ncbi:uncharacterized protein LOC110019957 isoform X2 [Phalaenopsis equestris]|uniref:uncharacterized protein LOC110019957 isoform X2 n=1 Tax=Phalaenopsis equestris TaxID=78828 RepID=UPI0009E276A7|nr:uncharacterized protein LOC110019957 isoform X2 [Phalaenopsis equestris]
MAVRFWVFVTWMGDYCIVEFDGACKGNPGQGGAGAVIRDSTGVVVSRVREPLGFTTNNVAEYEGLIIGLKEALEMGYRDVHARADSQLVCKQVNGSWRVRSRNLYEYYERAFVLIEMLDRFEIQHVPRNCNTEADAEANQAANM